MIFDLKRVGCTDAFIVDELKRKGFTAYKPSSISSRYQRIVKKIQKDHDDLLDEELFEWFEAEVNAYMSVDQEPELICNSGRETHHSIQSGEQENRHGNGRHSRQALAICRSAYQQERRNA